MRQSTEFSELLTDFVQNFFATPSKPQSNKCNCGSKEGKCKCSSIDRFIDEMENKYDFNEEIKYSEKIDKKVLDNVNKLVDKYYNTEISDKLGVFKSEIVENAIKDNYREFLSWVFTQL